jgi:protein O-mannosyl-transferase
MEKIFKKHSVLIFLVLIFIVISYSNTFHVPFMLDDRGNIVERTNLHLHNLTIDNITSTFFRTTEQGKKLYRPISSLSIALNYYIGKYNVTGYHITNLLFHLITTFFLFKTILLLLSLKKYNLKNSEAISIAALATILWAANPIQTQAVTYIIQRMAVLAAMFYVIGLWCYIKFRTSIDDSNISFKDILWAIFSFLFFLCALFSKENAIIFPFGIFLIELFFFNTYEKIKNNPLKTILIASIIILIPFLYFVHSTSLEKIFSSHYLHRPFTLYQRLLTEPRILLFYISQLLYPVPGRFSISHSFVLSDSLFSPLSTIISIVTIVTIFVVLFIKHKKFPLIGFPILFYFSHHLVESSFIPLELIFEHRNYLPSLFFFLPIALGLVKLTSLYKNQKPLMYYTIISFTCLIIFFMGLSTHNRNHIWRTHNSLWKNALKNAPDVIRPYSQLGWYYTNEHRMNLEKAIYYFEQGLDKKISYNVFEKVHLLVNMAKAYEFTDREKALKILLECSALVDIEIKNTPELIEKDFTEHLLEVINYHISTNYFYLKNIDKAINYIDKALLYNNKPVFINAKAKYLILKHQYFDANKLLRNSLKKNHNNWNTYFLLGNSFTYTKNFYQGFWFYKQALKKTKLDGNSNSNIYLYMAENLYLANKNDLADKYIDKFVQANSTKKIITFVDKAKKRHSTIPLFVMPDLIFSKIKNSLSKFSNDL